MSQREQAKADLVLVTIELLEAGGLANLTVRAIAERAGVNVAAINYYFGSKAKLIAAALEGSLAHLTADLDAALPRLREHPEETLRELLGYIVEGALRYPELIRAHIDAFFLRGPESPYPGVPTFDRAFAPLTRALRELLRARGLDDQEANARVQTALSAVLFPSLFAGFFSPGFEDPAHRAAYLERVAAAVLA